MDSLRDIAYFFQTVNYHAIYPNYQQGKNQLFFFKLMGSIICHNLKSNNNQQLAQLIQQRSQQQKYSQNLDLPYRHYIHKNIYIPSALPNSFQHYIPRRKLIIAPSIQQSSIMQRRNRAQLTDMFKITKQMEIDLLGR